MTPIAGSWTLLGVFLVGLGLNLTPCVYPMLSITVSLFGTHQETNRRKTFLKALVYVLGIATMYSSLGVAAALTGGFFGSLLQKQWILIAVGALLIILSLSLFGVYTFQAPSFLLSKLATKRGINLIGFYLSGLFVGIFAAPCVGPPVVALLTVVGTKGDPLYGFWIFFLMSLGLGTPYLILATYSGLLKRLPKSGVWLLWVERLFGVVLLSVGAFYLALAFRPAFAKWMIPMALTGGGIYLGFIETSPKYSAWFIQFKKTLGVLAIVAGVAIPGFAPHQTVTWEKYTPQKLELAKSSAKPVILDFYADWCIPCHELDRFTYSDPEVIKALSGFERLKVDLTRPDSPAAAEPAENFEIIGVPTIVFLDSKGQEIKEDRVTGFISAKELLSILHSSQFSDSTKRQ